MITSDFYETCDLEVAVENAAWLSANDKNEFCRIRRKGFGCSDSSIILGVNLYKNIAQLILEKQATEVSKEEQRVGNLPQVRKGADLEPIILRKFEEWSGMEVSKPEQMFRFKKYPWLTVNFDGVTDNLIPVEAKLVTMYGEKHWSKGKALANPYLGRELKFPKNNNVVQYINEVAKEYGVPPYYWTQCQQEMLALNADFSYLAAMFDKDWELRVYRIYKDEFIQNKLIELSEQVWNEVKKGE